MLENLVEIDKSQLLDEAANTKKQGYRLAAVTCENEGEDYEVIYHFDKNYEMKNIKVMTKESDKKIQSISHIYPAAFLIENEFQDLYGMIFEGLTIDYKGRLYLTEHSKQTPMVRK